MESLELIHLRQFYSGRRILVTGHTGFKGAWLCWVLRELGASVAGYGLAPLPGTIYAQSRLSVELAENDFRGDIRDYKRLSIVIQSFEPDIIFHLAAQPLVRNSYRQPLETYSTNLMGTLNVLECMRVYEKKLTAILVTTDKCYENNGQIWPYREDEPLGGHDPYSSSKACCELAIASWRRSYFPAEGYSEHKKAIASVRAGNIIGGGDRAPDRIIPDAVRAIESGEPLKLRYPAAIRPWQHVLDPVFAYLYLAKKMEETPSLFAAAWNIGPDVDSFVSVESLVGKFYEVIGKGEVDAVTDRKEMLHEAANLTLDTTKARSILGLKPVLKLDQALDWTAEWYMSAEDKRSLTLGQISSFFEMVRI